MDVDQLNVATVNEALTVGTWHACSKNFHLKTESVAKAFQSHLYMVASVFRDKHDVHTKNHPLVNEIKPNLNEGEPKIQFFFCPLEYLTNFCIVSYLW